MAQKTAKVKEPEKKKEEEPVSALSPMTTIKEQYRSVIMSIIFIVVGVIIVGCAILFLPTKPKVERLPDVTAELYETVEFEVQSAEVLVYGPVETKAFPSGNKTYFIPRKEGVYYLFFVNAGGIVRKPCYVGRVTCGSVDPGPQPNPQPEPQPSVSSFQDKFRELLLSNIPASYREGVGPGLAAACAKVRSMNSLSEEELLENLQKEQRAALDWDNAAPEFRASWFAFFQAEGPVDILIKDTYPDKVNWSSVLQDMEAVYKGL